MVSRICIDCGKNFEFIRANITGEAVCEHCGGVYYDDPNDFAPNRHDWIKDLWRQVKEGGIENTSIGKIVKRSMVERGLSLDDFGKEQK